MEITEITFGKHRYHQNAEICEWLYHNVGDGGWYRQNVEEGKSWARTVTFGNTTFYFKNPKDATMFLLRWS